MKQTDIITCIERTAPLALAASWDVSGLQVAAARPDVAHLVVCLDPTPASVEAALAMGAEMILAHHPLALGGLDLSRLDAAHAVVRALMQHDVPLYAAHTSLDANPCGPVSWLARELALDELAVLEPSTRHVFGDEERECGFGLAGRLPEPLALASLVAGLTPWVERSAMRVAGEVPEQITRVGICPGSGSSLDKAARARGCDVLITGDTKYHTALDAATCLLDVGHFALEEEMMRRFADELATALPSIRVSFVAAHNPFRPC